MSKGMEAKQVFWFVVLARIQDRGTTRCRTALGGAAPHLDTLLKLADVLDVSLDELTGRANIQNEGRIRNPELNQLVHEVDTLPDDEQQALVLVIDSMVKRTKINRMATSSPRKRASSGVRASR